VQHTAQVAESAYVGPRAEVCGRAEVSGNARIVHSIVMSDSQIRDNAWIVKGAVVSGARIHATSKGRPRISGSAKVIGDSNVYDGVRVSGSARVVDSNLAHTDNEVEVSGTAVVRGAVFIHKGKVNCGRWANIIVSTDRTGECGHNGKVKKILNLPALPGIDQDNTETAESTD